MSLADAKLEALLQQTAKDWSKYMVPKLEDSVDKKKLKRTGELEGSFQTYFTEDGKGGVVVHIKYLAYGNVLTRSRVFWTKPANGYALLDWVKKVGVGYFTYLPGYADGAITDHSRFGISTDAQAKRIASAIAFQRVNGSVRKEYGRMKARNWKRKPLGTGKGYLGHLIRERISELTKKEIVEALTTQ